MSALTLRRQVPQFAPPSPPTDEDKQAAANTPATPRSGKQGTA